MMIEIIISLLIGTSIYLRKPLPRSTDRKIGKFRNKKPKIIEQNINDTRDVVELLILALSAGVTIPQAIQTTSSNSNTHLAKELGVAINSHKLGASLDQELNQVAQGDRYWKLLTRQLQQSWEQGASIMENLIELNEYFIDLERAQVLKKVRSAGVRSVLPLGVCFLPAFMLVVVIPLVANLINF